jgi:hypothetical protein
MLVWFAWGMFPNVSCVGILVPNVVVGDGVELLKGERA